MSALHWIIQLTCYALAAEALRPTKGDDSNITARKGRTDNIYHQEACLTKTPALLCCPGGNVPAGSYCKATSALQTQACQLLFCNNKRR